MKATVTKIDQPKVSSYQATFIRIYFNGEDGNWYQTDVVPVYRNYKNWRPVIEKGIGVKLDGLMLKSKSKIDADSPVRIIGMAKAEEITSIQETLL